jgi:hypothetical protein
MYPVFFYCTPIISCHKCPEEILFYLGYSLLSKIKCCDYIDMKLESDYIHSHKDKDQYNYHRDRDQTNDYNRGYNTIPYVEKLIGLALADHRRCNIAYSGNLFSERSAFIY